MALRVNPSPLIQLQSVSEARLGVITTIRYPPYPITTDRGPFLQTTNAAEPFYKEGEGWNRCYGAVWAM